jgi:hypothetical protein
MGIAAVREEAYGAKPFEAKPTGTKQHGTHSVASAAGGGVPVGNANPAFQIKHPNFCPQCGEPLAGHSTPHVMGQGPAFEGSPTEEAGESPAFEEKEDEGEAEMKGSPATGSKKRTKGTKLKKK